MNANPTLRGGGAALAALALAAAINPGPAASAESALGSAATSNPAVQMAGAGTTKKVRYGATVRIAGTVAPGSAGQAVSLQRAAGGAGFQAVAQTTTGAGGSYAFKVKARQSSAYRAVAQNGAAATAPRRFTVVARIAGRARRNTLGVRPVRVRGTLLPRLRGKAVRLQRRSGGRWRTVARARTGRGGRFRATFRPRRAGSYRLRVRFGGDASAAGARDVLPLVRVYRPGGASWYGGGGTTACGGSVSGLGVANKYLPCGTKVTLRYRGRTVTATVKDRGPYVAGRDWDLMPATKAALGFGDTGTVWSTR